MRRALLPAAFTAAAGLLLGLLLGRPGKPEDRDFLAPREIVVMPPAGPPIQCRVADILARNGSLRLGEPAPGAWRVKLQAADGQVLAVYTATPRVTAP